jgi:hypothetical protein
MCAIHTPVLNYRRHVEMKFTSAKKICATKDILGNILQSKYHENKRIRLRLVRLGMKYFKKTLI